MVLISLLLRILSNPFANVLQKKLSTEKFASFYINFITYFGLVVFCIPIILNTEWGSFSVLLWKYAILGGVCGALGNAFLVKALSLGELSILGPINSYKAVVAMILGIFTLGEIPSTLGIFATILIIIGSYFVIDCGENSFSSIANEINLPLKQSSTKIELNHLSNFNQSYQMIPILYRFAALIFTAIEALMIKHVIILSNVMVSFTLWAVFGMVFSFVFMLMRREKFQRITTNIAPKFVLLIASFGIMQITTNYVFKHMNVSYALSVFQLSSLISVIFGYKFFKETHIIKKIIGSTIMILGSILLILCL